MTLKDSQDNVFVNIQNNKHKDEKIYHKKTAK